MSEKWIDVKDKLPKKKEKVLIYNGGIYTGCVILTDFSGDIVPQWCWRPKREEYELFIADVTHWMLLPDAPKEKD